jgi:carboxypeptidase T
MSDVLRKCTSRSTVAAPKAISVLALVVALCDSSLALALGPDAKDTMAIWSQHAITTLPSDKRESLDVLGRDAKTGGLVVRGPRQLLDLVRHFGVSSFNGKTPWSTTQSADGYLEPHEVVDELASLAQANPNHMRLETIGQSHQGRPIVALIIERDAAQQDPKQDPYRPTIVFDGMHHAREVMTTEVVVSIAKAFSEALQGTAEDQELVHWANTYRIVLAPQINPDGSALVHSGQPLWRKNAWQDSNKTVGVDLNRNYPSYWGACSGSSGRGSSDTYRGPSPASEPETRAFMDLVANYGPVATISYHAFSELIIFPYGCNEVNNPARDVFVSLAQAMNNSIRNDRGRTSAYDIGTAPELLYNADGTDLDWQWDEHGVFAYTIEINSSPQGFQPEYARWRDRTVQNQAGGWRAMIRQLEGPGLSGNLSLDAAQTGDWRAVGYTLEKDTSGDQGKGAAEPLGWQPFAADLKGTKRFPLRDAQGQFYVLTTPGRYRLRFWLGDRVVAEHVAEVGSTHRNLGSIALEPGQGS